jgi:hypothetical protein
MRRPLTFRLGTALAAFVFAATGGISGMKLHPLAAASEHAPAADAHAHHAGHGAEHTNALGQASALGRIAAPSGHEGHEGHHPPGQECTCVGPCQGGATPSLSGPDASGLALSAPDLEPVAAAPARQIHQDPRSHILPLANAPPARV